MPGRSGRGNFVSEWFGYRIYPQVLGDAAALRTQRAGRCPFLTAAAGDWLVCPNPA